MATIEDSIKLQLARAVSLGAASSDPASKYTGTKEVSRPATGQPTCLQDLGDDTRILAGNAGDNPLVQQLLVQAYQLPVADDFQSRLDEPLYEPSDRLLLQRAGQLIGHVQVSKLIGWFHGQQFPIAPDAF